MTNTGEATHVMDLISDYVLELLPGDERAQVGAHVARCQECRSALTRERNIGQLVQATLSEVPAPERARIQRLMPHPPARQTRKILPLRFSPGWAAAAIMLLLICSTIFLYLNQRPGAWSLTSPTAWPTAVMLTDTPTQTATREIVVTAAQSSSYAPSTNTPSGHSASGATGPQPIIVPVPAAPLLH